MTKTFQLSTADLTTLMALMPAPVFDKRRRRGVSFDGTMLTVEDDAEAARLLTVMADPRWRDTAKIKQLKGHAAYLRYKKEIAGITVHNIPISTDRDSQVKLMVAMIMAQADPTMIFPWKKSDGSFAQLTAQQVIDIGKAVVAHVQACFAAEANAGATITANPAAVTEANIEAIFSRVR
jgi:Domain of unknown function (DUF4376)